MKKIAVFLRPYRLKMAAAILMMLLELGAELIQPLLIAKIIDDGILKKDLSQVFYWSAVMGTIALIAFAGGILNSFTASAASQGFGADVRRELFRKVQYLSFEKLSEFSTSSLAVRMSGDVTVLQNTVFMGLRIMMRAPLIVLGGTILAVIVHPGLGGILAAAMPLMVVFLIWMMNRAMNLFKGVQNKLDRLNRVVRENLAAVRLIKAYMRTDFENGRLLTASSKLKEQTQASLRFIETVQPVLLLVMNGSIAVILWMGHEAVGGDAAQAGAVVAVVNYGTRITASLSVFSWLIMSISRARASAARISEVFETDEEVLSSEQHLVKAEGHLSFEHVSFRYPGASHPVLEDISFTIPAGSTAAVMGAAGSGKTSLIQLIPRLYEPDSGIIRIDGINIKDWNAKELRGQIGYVPQEALLFTGSIQSNISWGKEEAGMEEVIEAAKAAQIHETIMEFPDGYKTMIGQSGVNLSGGQKQRVSIARALVRNPAVLLLDDSTSALDLKTESKFMEALENYSCTTILITQKISTAQKADWIILIDGGLVLAQGTHAGLAETCTLYQQLISSQYGQRGRQI